MGLKLHYTQQSQGSKPKSVTRGFTIVELVVIIVVIGVLATIVTLSYTAVLNNSRTQSLNSDIKTAYSKLVKYRADSGNYPTTLSAVSVTSDTTTTYAYTYTAASDTFCLAATAYSTTVHIVSGNAEPITGGC